MGFRENLKAELSYSGIRVKELAELSGLKKQTLDSYLREKNYTPSVEAAVRLAKVLGVSVEYLVMGEKEENSKSISSLSPDIRMILQSLQKLDEEDRKIVIKNAINLIESMKSRKRQTGRKANGYIIPNTARIIPPE